MKKLTKKEIAERIVDLTFDYSDLYVANKNDKRIDKQLWAALHLGFVAGMKLNGYGEEYIMGAVEMAQEELKDKN